MAASTTAIMYGIFTREESNGILVYKPSRALEKSERQKIGDAFRKRIEGVLGWYDAPTDGKLNTLRFESLRGGDSPHHSPELNIVIRAKSIKVKSYNSDKKYMKNLKEIADNVVQQIPR